MKKVLALLALAFAPVAFADDAQTTPPAAGTETGAVVTTGDSTEVKTTTTATA